MSTTTEIQKIEQAIQAQENLRGLVPDDQIDATIKPLRVKLDQLKTEDQSGGVNFVDSKADIEGDVVGRDKNVFIINPPSTSKSLPHPEALQKYLDHLIAVHQRLRLQGIRAGSQPLSIDLEKVYVSLTTVEKGGQGGLLTIPDALKRHKRLVIIGDPGSGKTTLLAYLALTYARTLRDGADTVQTRLQLNETEHLPILLPLRDLGRHLLNAHKDSSKDGAAILLNYLREYYEAQTIHLPEDFFANALEQGFAVLLLDGMDEVAEKSLRQRVARLIEKFVQSYKHSDNRFIVTSREVGYEGVARIGENFNLAKVRDFNRAEVRAFVRDWTRAVESTLAGNESPELLRLADEQAEKLIKAIEGNTRVGELAVNPLLLTVIALVHRYRATLPDRRSELYEEAIEVLLGHWDEAKGLETEVMLGGRALDSGDRRTLLEPVAFWMHEQRVREIELDQLRNLLLPVFNNGDAASAAKTFESFIRLINERSGLLIERGVGAYSFAHLTFQEYLTARAVADRADAVKYIVERLPDAWWREVILLTAGYLSTQGKRRVSELIRAIINADPETEPDPCNNLILAGECLLDAGSARVESEVMSELKARLQKDADSPFKKENRPQTLRKIAATSALGRIESGTLAASKFWKAPWGEPDWVMIPAGEFWMGSEKGGIDEKPMHRVHVTEFQIARTTISNYQYQLYVVDAKVKPPDHWRDDQPLKGKENCPVRSVTWHDARNYCAWLSEKINREVRLPTEAEWEKAARGDKDKRVYPWGDDWRELHCNSDELGFYASTPAGIFLNGASPYGVLDMSGNVMEWTMSLWGNDNDQLFNPPSFKYPYNAKDGRENLNAPDDVCRVVRSGMWLSAQEGCRVTVRFGFPPLAFDIPIGFRAALSPVWG